MSKLNNEYATKAGFPLVQEGRVRIEDIQAVGEELNEEHLRLVSGGMPPPRGGMTGCTPVPGCFPDFPPGA
jgi:hypothetical protein